MRFWTVSNRGLKKSPSDPASDRCSILAAGGRRPRADPRIHRQDNPGAAGLSERTSCHTFRATGITAYLENGGTIENAQAIAAHESPPTTKLYDRTSDEITLDEIERILI